MKRTRRSSQTKRATQGRRGPENRRRRLRERSSQPSDRAESGAEDSFLFDDPYWDDAFGSYYDPTLGTCCRI
jgi:hypothetical protein